MYAETLKNQILETSGDVRSAKRYLARWDDEQMLYGMYPSLKIHYRFEKIPRFQFKLNGGR